MNLTQFKKRFKEIQGKVYKSSRGDGAAGHKLESLLGMTENNFASPDLGKIELKVHRNSSNSPITLFTYDRDSWVMTPMTVVKEFGHYDGDIKRLNTRINFKRNNLGLRLEIDYDTLIARYEHENRKRGCVLISWYLDDIKERFNQKLPALILVKADTTKSPAGEKISFRKAYFMKNPSKKNIIQQLKEGNIWIELRMKLRGNGTIRSHGVGFRTTEANLNKLFQKVDLIK
jgi:hypothetical protein